MANWLEETRKNIQILKDEKYFNNWDKKESGLITFYLHPKLELPSDWIEKRVSIYKENSEKLGVVSPKINFYIYPSIAVGKTLGITPAVSFISTKEIHGHLDQSPGHELTHILLGELNTTDNLPANGLWSESVCVYLDGTNTDRHKHTSSLNYSKESFSTPWEEWNKNLPGNLYPLAGSIMQYLDGEMGWKSVLDFLKRIKNSAKNADEVAIEIFKTPLGSIRKDWKVWLETNI